MMDGLHRHTRLQIVCACMRSRSATSHKTSRPSAHRPLISSPASARLRPPSSTCFFPSSAESTQLYDRSQTTEMRVSSKATT
eukprot:scaffold102_cov27-Tisochrysis_lutea.AAC.5